ncbi:MAG: hypothetical protein ACUVQP_03670 [Bacteroidales bacterium]
MKIQVARDSRELSLYTIEKDFSGGLNESPNRTPNQARFTHNVYIDETGVLRPRPALKQIGSTPTNFFVKRAFSYVDRTSTHKLALTNNVNVKITSDFNNYTTIPDASNPQNPLTLNSAFDTKMTSYLGYLIGTNGYNYVWRYDGNSTIFETAAYKARYIITYADRVWLLNDDYNPDGLYYSSIGLAGSTPAERFPATNVIKITSQKSGQGTGLAICKHGLIIFKNDAIRLLTGTSEETFELITLSDNIGCVNSDTIQEYNGWVIFLSRNGFYMTDGTQIIQLPKNVENSIKSMSQIYDQKMFETSIIKSEWLNKRYSYSSNFYPTQTLNEIFVADTMYSDQNINSWIIPNGNFTQGWTGWTKTISSDASNKIIWDIVEGKGTLRNSIAWHYTGGENGFCPIPRKIKYQLYNIDLNEKIKENEYYFDDFRDGINEGGMSFIDASTIDIKHKNCRVKWKITIECFKAMCTNSDRTQIYNTGISDMATLESPPFLLAKINGNLYFYWVRKLTYNNEGSLPNGLWYMRIYNSSLSFYSFTGAARYNTFSWVSKEIPVNQDFWGPVEYDYNEHGNTWNKTFQMRFYNSSNQTWSNYIDVVNGEVVPDPNPPGITSKIQIYIHCYNTNGYEKPIQLNFFKFVYYQSLVNAPKSKHNMSSLIWKNKYLLAYTETFAQENAPILIIDGTDQEIGYRYFKWEICRTSAMVNFAHMPLVLIDDTNSNVTNICELVDGYNDRRLPRDGIATIEYEYFLDDGIFKNIRAISIMHYTMINKRYNVFTKYDNQLKIEVWLKHGDKEIYAGDLNVWAWTDDYNTKYSYLLPFNSYEVRPLNSTGTPTPKAIWIQKPDITMTKENYEAWIKENKVPIGWANSIIFKIFWAKFDFTTEQDDVFYDFISLRGLKVDYEIRDKDLLDRNAWIREGKL